MNEVFLLIKNEKKLATDRENAPEYIGVAEYIDKEIYGIFSTKEKAIQCLSQIPESHENFNIYRYELDKLRICYA